MYMHALLGPAPGWVVVSPPPRPAAAAATAAAAFGWMAMPPLSSGPLLVRFVLPILRCPLACFCRKLMASAQSSEGLAASYCPAGLLM